MTMGMINRRGQSVAEYAVLLGLVIGAFVTMQVYARRGLQARVKSGTDALTGPTTTITAGSSGSAVTATFAAQSQYEPYYAESSSDVYQESVEREHMGAGKVIKEKVSDLTVRRAGAYSKQKGTGGRATADALWNNATPASSGQ